MYIIRVHTTSNRKWFAEILESPETDQEVAVYRTADYSSRLTAIIIANAVREKHFPDLQPFAHSS